MHILIIITIILILMSFHGNETSVALTIKADTETTINVTVMSCKSNSGGRPWNSCQHKQAKKDGQFLRPCNCIIGIIIIIIQQL